MVIQTRRTVEAISQNEILTADEIGEIGQFLSTLFVLQGIADIDSKDKSILFPKLEQWGREYPGRLACEVSERCLALLQDDP